MKYAHQAIRGGLLGPALVLSMVVPAAMAADIPASTLYFTTYCCDTTPNSTNNVFKTPFSYIGGVFSIGPTITPVAAVNGADALIFAPGSTTKLITSGQDQNNVTLIDTVAVTKTQVTADSSLANPQAFGLTANPAGTLLYSVPNSGSGAFIDTIPLPLSAGTPGISHAVTGIDKALRGLYFDNAGNLFYGTADDNGTGNFGTIDLGTFATTQWSVLPAGPGCTITGQGCVPSHHGVFDPFSNSLLIGGGACQIWQLSLNVATKTATIVSKYINSRGAACSIDQISVDGKGNVLVADAKAGNVIFLDYSSDKLIGTAGHQKYDAFLANKLDDLANVIVIPDLKLFCPASTGFVGVPYSSNLTATGGTPPYTFSIVSGLPADGLALTNASTGLISGTPTAAGSIVFTAKVTDSTAGTALTVSKECTILISPIGCPATKGFWHNPDLHIWPDTAVDVPVKDGDGDGTVVHYLGKTANPLTNKGMIIGGVSYSQAQLLALMPTSGGAKGNAFVITGSQLIAAVLNIAAGAQHSVGVDNTIDAVDDLLIGVRMVGASLSLTDLTVNTPSANLNDALKVFTQTLDDFNSALGLNCTEASGLKLGS